MRVFYRNNEASQTPDSRASKEDVALVVKKLIKVMTDKKMSEGNRHKAFTFFYAVPPSQRDEAWVTAAATFLNQLQ